jgi:hypothetical protein
VSGYTATPFLATWTDISTTADTFHYNKTNEGWGTIAMPFDFPYDDSIIHAGSIIRIGASGAISLSSDTTPNGPELDSAGFPALVCVFSAMLLAGSGKAAFNEDYYEIDGAAPNRVLTVEYHATHMPGTGGGGGGGGGTGGGSAGSGYANMMQVKFYETTGVIEFIYSAHDSAFEPAPAFLGGIGLNGFSRPKFVANIYAANVTATPATDIRWTPGASGVEMKEEQDGFVLGQSYPNPASGNVEIPFTLPTDATASIVLLDISGQTIETVYSGALSSGDHAFQIDTKGLPCGTYFYTLTSGGEQLTRQMTIIR